MRRFLVLLAALVLTSAADVFANSIKDINISVVLHKDGSATVNETWNVDTDDGTEWYLVRNNLGDIEISGLTVRDGERALVNVGKWNVDWSRKEKDGKCGINPTSSGVELCWGMGGYGKHTYNVSYRMSNVVKSLSDYDVLHLQLVSPGLSSRPEHAKVSIKAEKIQLDTSNTRAWGFGYEGSTAITADGVIFESDKSLSSSHSIIALMRFEKGMFQSNSFMDMSFDELAAIASEDAYFGEDDDLTLTEIFTIIFTVFVAPVLLVLFVGRWSKRKTRKKILGVADIEDLGWGREIPFDGDLCQSEYILRRLGEDKKSNALASALILRMIYNGVIVVSKDDGKKVELSFDDNKQMDMDNLSSELYSMMKRASGKDLILQSREFSRWSESHTKEVHDWAKLCISEGGVRMRAKGHITGKSFTASGKNEAVKLMSFRNFLKDFTMIEVRSSKEASMWKEYLVFGALFGIADKVAEQLKEIDPQMFEETFGQDYNTMRRIIIANNTLSNSITNASMTQQINTSASGASGGFGGRSSIGGGRGFSGGGFGGGAR